MHHPQDREAGPTSGPGSAGGGRDRIAAVVRDPETVFIYWELSGARSADAVAALGSDCGWYLRVLNLSEGSSTAIPVDPQARNHYLEVAPGTTYGFELAASDKERWRPVCRTDRVEVPPGEPEVRAVRRGAEAAHAPTRGFDRSRRPTLVEVAGLRYETTALFLGSSSPPKAAGEQDADQTEKTEGTEGTEGKED